MRKRILIMLLSFTCLLITALPVNATNVSAKSAVLIECGNHEIAYAKNENARLPMASTTKIMTALVVIENLPLDKEITIEPCMTGIEGSSIYLQVGETLTVCDLLYALLLESANDAAVALAIATVGSVESFADLMNKKATELGLINTHFTNPHGLDDSDHYTTAYELALISACAMENEVFKEIASTYKKEIPLNNGEGCRVLVNHNRLLRSYEGADGVKTGFTKKCGRCLVSSATRDGVTLICVTLNAPNDWQDHKQLLDFGFSKYESVSLATKGCYTVELQLLGGEKSTLLAENKDDLSITVERGSDNIYAVLESNRFLTAPIRVGDCVAKIVYCRDGKKIAELPLFAKEGVKRLNYNKSFFERMFNNGKNQTSEILYR